MKRGEGIRARVIVHSVTVREYLDILNNFVF
jgi:hypothetical protein